MSISWRCYASRPSTSGRRRKSTASWISAEIIQDPHSGTSYYTAHIAVPEVEIGRLHGLKIIPGMPVEAFIQTESRTVLSYLLKPLRDQLMRTFREG